MKKLLADPNREIKTRKKRKISTKTVTNDLVEQPKNIISVEQTKKETPTEQENNKIGESLKQQDGEMALLNLNLKSMTKEDCLKILELLRTPYFTKMISMYSPKEAMIVSLKLGYVDGKYFSTSAISEFLGIEQQEVIDITKKALFAYKEGINQIVDDAMKIVTEESETIFEHCKAK